MSKPKMYGLNKAADHKGKRRSELLWSRKKIQTMSAKEYVTAARRRGMEGK